jgi:uncharacterized protein YjbJ (UPF0337 family)
LRVGQLEGYPVNRYQFRGRAKQAAGTVEKIVGRAVGSPGMEAKGIVKEIAGKMEKTAGDVAGGLEKKK